MTERRKGYAVSSLAQLGDGYGFRKIRRELGITAFGINALVLPGDYSTGVHYHDEQEETYFVHKGQVEFRFGDGTRHLLGPGGIVRVDAQMHRGLRNAGQSEAIVIVAGGKDGYVGRDGQAVGASAPGGPPGAPATDSADTDAARPDAPATDAPATDLPATDTPATDAAATDAPATHPAATDTPATDAPAA